MSKKSTNTPISKKEQFIEAQRPEKTFKPFFLIAGLAVLIVAAGALWFSGVFSSRIQAQPANAVAPTTASTSQSLAFNTAEFNDGKARHYSYADPAGLKIRFFILKSSDGVVRSAFDACDVCWRSGLGYQQEGDHMVCRNCGQRFVSTRINEVKGGCNPTPLNRKIEGGQIIIDVRDILAGRGYFEI